MYRVQKIFHNNMQRLQQPEKKVVKQKRVKEIWLICYFSTRSESRVGGHSTRWGQVDLHYFVSEAQTFTLTTIDDIVWDVISPSIHRSYFYIKFDSVRRGEITTLQTAEEKKSSWCTAELSRVVDSRLSRCCFIMWKCDGNDSGENLCHEKNLSSLEFCLLEDTSDWKKLKNWNWVIKFKKI